MMQYFGGKYRVRKALASLIGNGQLVIEPFMGGGSMTVMLAQQFDVVQSYDIHEDLILMWQALQNGWIPPNEISEVQYRELMFAKPSALRGFVGFGCSWGGRWFEGYARGRNQYARMTAKSLLRDLPFIAKAKIARMDYRTLTIPPGAVVYADPPYVTSRQNQSNIAKVKWNRFNHDEFWQIADGWVKNGAKVFVSESLAPENWRLIWEHHKSMHINTGEETVMVERLYCR